MSFIRSETMFHKKLRFPKHKGMQILHSLGKEDSVFEFIDMNKNNSENKKNFNKLIRRCDEIDTKINKIGIICDHFNIEHQKIKKFEDYVRYFDIFEDKVKREGKLGFDFIESEINKDSLDIGELFSNFKSIEENLIVLNEKKEVWDKLNYMILNKLNKNSFLEEKLSFVEETEASGVEFIAGVVGFEDSMRMKKMVFRASKGRAIFETFEMISHQRKIFLIVLPGSREGLMYSKLMKICDLFNVSRYKVPTINEFQIEKPQLDSEIAQTQNILFESKQTAIKYLKQRIGDISDPHKYDFYRLYVKNEKYIYNNLNRCNITENFIDAEVFIPESKLQIVNNTISSILSLDDNAPTFSISNGDGNVKLPTYIQTNDFTWSFQQIVDTYGTPRYQEFNPSVFNIVTFPFLFGVMFGDIAHGLILFIFGLYLLLNAKNLKENPNSMLQSSGPLKYMIPMMGFFSLYCGFLYNDFASTSLPLGNSCWENVYKQVKVDQNTIEYFDTAKKNCNYIFGIDHKWNSSTNELSFLNSLKMKIAVIIGVLHMSLGIVIKGVNCIYFGDMLSFWAEFIPQIVFMLAVFGYMDVMIFIKWVSSRFNENTNMAPNLTSNLLGMFLNLGSLNGTPLSQKDVTFLFRQSQKNGKMIL